jgi:hypothetical protein
MVVVDVDERLVAHDQPKMSFVATDEVAGVAAVGAPGAD